MRNAQRSIRDAKPAHQVIVTGQSLGARITNLKDALQFYLPGYDVFNVAVPGSGYTGLKYNNYAFMRSIVAGGDIVIAVHGEYDTITAVSAATYAGYLQEWRDDYAKYLNKPNLKLLFCQCSSVLLDTTGTPSLYGPPFGQYNAALDGTHTGLYLMGPKYYFPYDAADYTHLITAGCSWLGQKYAQIIGRLVNTGNWKPLYPLSIGRTGAAVTITLNVPVGPLVFDTTTIGAHPNGKYGLVYNDAGGTISISSTPLISGNTITFNLSGTPSTTPRKIRYGYYAAAGTTPVVYAGYPNSYAAGGMVYGNIRDSDTVSRYVEGSYNMGNWLVHFEMDVP